MRINRAEIIELVNDNRELQETIMASHLPQTRSRTKRMIIDRDAYDHHDEVSIPLSSPSSKKTRVGKGESSNSPSTTIIPSSAKKKEASSFKKKTFVCKICIETKPYSESFAIMGCTHCYCSDCVIKYVSSKLDQNITQIRCPIPDCNKGVLEPEHCRAILPPEVFDKWGSALCESAIAASKKFYCPYKDCSAFMIDDDDGDGEVEAIAKAGCLYCNRYFCAQCKVPWHKGIDCSEFQKLHEDEREREDIMLLKLAKKKKWARCPHCKAYVEKKGGCNNMFCRFAFLLPLCFLSSC
ncbi:hypothetical protein RHSIM_Rhsim04G0115500 [Rhododendron simsii]|uniref:RBR-type E3 ubiquitin transferase n=1 Tax=Rhododendron simsii TaxID=118357 RepID=A0A834H554_RHOSS|nr:hypothetical protein RHSIM_Rhsim04G0115500 [Rhododendron simsii]